MVQVWVFGVLSSECLISFDPFLSHCIFWIERDKPLLNNQIWLNHQFNLCVYSFQRSDVQLQQLECTFLGDPIQCFADSGSQESRI